MTRVMMPAHQLLLGFDTLERLVQRTAQPGGQGYPPYNIERRAKSETSPEVLRITLAVAGFTQADLVIQVEDRQLSIQGRQRDDTQRDYVVRGIAARQFCRTFVLADGLEVRAADLDNGLLWIDLVAREPQGAVRTIPIGGGTVGDANGDGNKRVEQPVVTTGTTVTQGTRKA